MAALHFAELEQRILYATPTQDQADAFWGEIKRSFSTMIDAGVLYKNESKNLIEIPGGPRIRAKTAWNADMLRGDYADTLILDEFQLMNETAWTEVGAPMLLDNDGDAVFIYTPPSLRTRTRSQARDPLFAAKMFKSAQTDTTGRWAAFHFSSHDNPHISQDALKSITSDMTALAYRQEIMAEDIEEIPGALWTRKMIDSHRVTTYPALVRIVVAIDPPASSGQDAAEAGIVVAGVGVDGHGYVLADGSKRGTPAEWAGAAVRLYDLHAADRIVAEKNNGGEMVEYTIRTVRTSIPVTTVWASRGKITRAEPVSALYEKGIVHHVGNFPDMEEQMCSYVPGAASPDRMDALVWALSDLMVTAGTMKRVAMRGI